MAHYGDQRLGIVSVACVFASALALALPHSTFAQAIPPGGYVARTPGKKDAADSETKQKATRRSNPKASSQTSGASGAPASGKAPVKKEAEKGMAARVRTEGAIVYTAPDFDADQIESLHEGQRVVVSKGTVGSVARFYKVRVGNKVGYVADIDVEPESSSPRDKRAGAAKSGRQAGADRSGKPRKEREPKRKRVPIYFTKYVGLVGGLVNYKESIAGVNATEALLFYGLKVTGPETFLTPVTDFNLMLHYGAPSYYAPLSSTKPAGFVLWADLLVILPLFSRDDFMIFGGAGPLAVLSNMKVTNTRRPMDLTQFNVGGSFAAGLAFRTDRVAFRLEGKYYLEAQSYQSVMGSVQLDY